EALSPRRMAELWSHWSALGPEYRQYVALVGGEIVGFSGSGPCRDPKEDAPRERELYFLYLLSAWHGTGIGQQLLDVAVEDDAVSLWVAEDNPRAHRFYQRNGFTPDGSRKVEPFLGETVTEVRL